MAETQAPPRPHLILGHRPRLEIPLAPQPSGSLPLWLSVRLPGPDAATRPEGRFAADPRLSESALELHWGETASIHGPWAVLTVSVGDQTWVLEQDLRHPHRWILETHTDRGRNWS